MEIMKFIKKLLPRIERSTVSDDLRTTEKELLKIGMPSWDAAADHVRSSKLTSDEAKEMQQAFVLNFDYDRAAKTPSFVQDIARRLKNLHGNVVYIQSILDTVVDRDIISSGMTSKAAFVIRAASNMSMVSRYLLSLLNYIYTVEAMARNNEVYDALALSKAELQYVEVNFKRFVGLFSRYSVDPERFKQTVEGLSEAIINAKTAAFLATIIEAKDPMEESGLAGFVGNPIYSVRLMVAQWQNERYEAAKSKKQQLELRLMYLEMNEKGKKDANVEKEIGMLQDRIDKLEYKLRDVDTELGI